MSKRSAIVGLTVVVVGMVAVAVPAEAARTCFGKRVTIKGTAGKDRLRGTPGADVIAGLGGRDRIAGRGGNDLICGGGGPDRLSGGGGNDKLDGQRGGDELLAGEGNDLLRGGGGGFTFNLPGAGDDRVDGSQGFDLVAFAKATSAVQVDLAAGTAIGEGNDTVTSGDGILGSDFDDVLRGNDGSNFFEGGPGNDQIFTGGNTGSFESPATSDGDFVAPDFFAPTDPDAPRGDDTVTGGAGIEIMLYDGAAEGVDVNLNSGKASGEGNDTLIDVQAAIGTQFDDKLMGNDEDNAFEPLAGNNTVNGGNGTDVAVYFDAVGPVTVDLAAGTASGTYTTFLAGGQESEAPGTDSLTKIENVWGSSEGDTLTGDAEANKIYAEDGDDKVVGAAGNDILDGGGGTDELDGGEGTDECLNGETETGCEGSPIRSPAPTVSRSSFAGSWAMHYVR